MKTDAILKSCLGLTVIGGSVATANAASDQDPKKPNVIFLVADDLGYGDINCNGETAPITPNVNALAEDGLRFIDAHACASTSTPSRYSLFTGHYNWRRNDTGIAPGDAAMIIKPEQYTIADMFRSVGYTTGAIGKWHLGLGDVRGEQDWNGTITPGLSDIGFDYSCIMAATADRVPCVFIENSKVDNYDPTAPIYVSYKKNFPGEPSGKNNPELLTKLHPSFGHDQAIVNGISRIGYMKGGGKALWVDENIADTIASKAINFIKKNSDKPFFLYVGTNDIHVPRYPHSRFQGKSGMGLRGDAIMQFDWTVGAIIKALKEQGLYENTLIVLTSDNGPIVDDGYADQAKELLGNHKPAHVYRGSKYSIYEGGTRIPFIATWPEEIKPGESNALFSQIDLYASLAELVHGKIEEGAAPDSENHLKALLGKDKKGRDYIVESSGGLAISTGKWKYIPEHINKKHPKRSNPAQLFDLSKDISEQNNVASQNPKIVKKLDKLLKAEIAKK